MTKIDFASLTDPECEVLVERMNDYYLDLLCLAALDYRAQVEALDHQRLVMTSAECKWHDVYTRAQKFVREGEMQARRLVPPSA